jgi:FixJ family two-component response regulator
MKERPLVAIVDDDESVREALPDLLQQFGYEAEAFSSAEEFLASGLVEKIKCLILDIAMPRMSGPALQHELVARGRKVPTIFITAHESMRPRVLDQGAVECVIKPFSDEALLKALNAVFGAN